MELSAFFTRARDASRKMARFSDAEKSRIIREIASALREGRKEILAENEKDIQEAEKNGIGAMKDRLLLTEERIDAIAQEAESVANLHDFVGEILSDEVRSSGIRIQKIRVPMGVIAMIYESRPNVTIDASVLALKSGNAILLKGGKEAAFSNRVLVKILRGVLEQWGVIDAVQLLDGATHEDTKTLMEAKGKIDLLIPRGGKGLIEFVTQYARVPVIETGASVVHTFIDASANLSMAVEIVINEKVRRVSVCNALDTLLVHEKVLESFLSLLSPRLQEHGVRVHADEQSFPLFSGTVERISEQAFATEWLDYDLSVKTVSGIDEALVHIERYSLGHSESIVTEDSSNAERFLSEVDAACVYHNASTAFSDGAQFGLGAEIGTSTQKLHARGPFALEALTSTKWVVRGNGEVRA